MPLSFKLPASLAVLLAALAGAAAEWPLQGAATAESADIQPAEQGLLPSYDTVPTPSCATQPAQFRASGEYLLWWMKPVCQKRPLLNSGSFDDAVPGAAGQPNTRSILGDSKYEMPAASGFRATAELWLMETPLGWEAAGFWLQEVDNTHAFQSTTGGPPTFIPFTDQNNISQALPFSVPGVVDANISATGSSQLWGAETNLLWCFLEERGACDRRATLIGGFRYLSLRDEIQITQTQTALGDASQVAVGAANFTTRNHFCGAQVGARFEATFGPWGIAATGKFAPGEVKLISDVAGNPLLADTQVLPGSVPGPLLAFPSNVGRQETWALSFANELSLRLLCRVTEHVMLTMGYDLLYLNRIVCPGDQQPVLVNVTQVPALGPLTGKLEPKPLLLHTDYFAQGLSAGVEVRW